MGAEHGFERGFDLVRRVEQYATNEPIVDWLREHAGGRALTYVHLTTVHDPHVPPDPARGLRYRDDPGRIAGELDGFYAQLTTRLGLTQDDASRAAIGSQVAGYDDDVVHTDERVGGLLAALDELGLSERSAVLITSDHGEGLWTREAFFSGRRGNALRAGEPATLFNTLMPTHGNQVHRELLQVPLVLRAPGLPAGLVVDGLVENLDLLPTLLELCRIPPPAGLQGESLLPTIHAGRSPKELAFAHTRFNSSIVDDQGMQLILPTELGRCQEGLETELYDLSRDPHARENIASERPDLVAELSAHVLERLRSGISGDAAEPSPAALEVLRGLGYVEAGIIDQAREELTTMTEAELVALVLDSDDCLARLEAARVLLDRELDTEQRSALAGRIDLEGSDSVKRVLVRLLGS
jgi:hypothetical protein